jgi:signal transduction histidine kinase
VETNRTSRKIHKDARPKPVDSAQRFGHRFTAPDSPAESPVHEESLLLSEQTGSASHRRVALATAAVLTIAFLSIISIGDRPLPHIAAYVPAVDSIMFSSALLTATLLYSQYYVGRQRSSLVLATGYLFAALIVVPHLLTFPGNFSPSGLLGANADTAFWLYYFCRVVLFLAVIAYSLLKEFQRPAGTMRAPAHVVIPSSVVAVAVAVILLTVLAIHNRYLPRIILDSVRSQGSPWDHFFAPSLILMSVAGLALLWRQRASVLTMWLLVAQLSWVLETLLLSLDRDRFSVFWYGGIFGQIASCFVLVALLYETTTLYARVAQTAEARSREGDRQRLALQVVTGSVAHELQQPLTAIILNGELVSLLLAQNSPKLRDARVRIDDMTSEARRASDIIHSIDVTLTGAASPRVPVSIARVVGDALKFLRSELRRNNVAVQLDIPSDLPTVLGNKSQLMQVLINLINNAIEAMANVRDRPRLLTIGASFGPPPNVFLTVADSGTGIADEHAARIFDPFFTTKSRGTGLGLAISRRIIEAHGGSISAARATGHGSVFEILLPSAHA